MVPSGTMWYLTTKRTKFFVILVIIMYLLDIGLSFTFSEQERVLMMSQPAYIIANIAFSFLGVAISEIFHRSKTYGLSNIRLDRFG